jgi:hypothetical protein
MSSKIKVSTPCSWCGLYWLRRKNQKGDPCCSIECRSNMKSYRSGKVSSQWPRKYKGESCRVYFSYCVVCWKAMAAQNSITKCCSDECRQKAQGAIKRRVYFKSCQSCGKLCTMRNWNSTRCQPCQTLFEWECERKYEKKRKLSKVGKLIPYVGERDRWKCSICHGKVKSQTYSAQDKWSPTIDHVIPVSQGGTDDLSNLKLAHMICNAKKGKFGGNEQLLLVG